MIEALFIIMLWLNDTSSTYNRPSGAAPAYLSSPDRVRWERLRQARMLFKGQHRQYFLLEGRSQYDYPEEDVNGQIINRYVTLNLCKLVSNTTADLLFGAKAKLDAPTPRQTDHLDGLSRRSLIHARLHEAAVQTSWAGGAYLESTLYKGEPHIEVVPCNEVYPQGRPMPDGQYARYVRYAADSVGEGESAVHLLLVTTYEPGVITRRLSVIDPKTGDRKSDAAIDRWPAFDGLTVEPVTRTGLTDNTITYLANKLDDATGLSDFDGLIELQDQVNAKFAQVARVLAKHADPKLAVPDQTAMPDGNLRARHDAYFFDNPDQIPRYITWSAELDAAMRDRDASILAFCAAAEMSPAGLGIRQGATPESARKLKLDMTKDLAKTNRKALLIEPAIARAIETAQRLDQASPLSRSYPVEPIGVTMRDGLPSDPLDDATAVATYRGAGVMSLEAAVEARIQDPDAAAVEVQRIRDEEKAKMPSILMSQTPDGGEPGESRVQPPVANDPADHQEAA